MRKISIFTRLLVLVLIMVRCSHSNSPTMPAIQGNLQVLHISLLSGITGDSMRSISIGCGSHKARIFIKNIGTTPMKGMYAATAGMNTDPKDLNPGMVGFYDVKIPCVDQLPPGPPVYNLNYTIKNSKGKVDYIGKAQFKTYEPCYNAQCTGYNVVSSAGKYRYPHPGDRVTLEFDVKNTGTARYSTAYVSRVEPSPYCSMTSVYTNEALQNLAPRTDITYAFGVTMNINESVPIHSSINLIIDIYPYDSNIYCGKPLRVPVSIEVK